MSSDDAVKNASVGRSTARSIQPVVMSGVREYAQGIEVSIGVREIPDGPRVVVCPINEAGGDGAEVDLLDLLRWLADHRPDLLSLAGLVSGGPEGSAVCCDRRMASLHKLVDGAMVHVSWCGICGMWSRNGESGGYAGSLDELISAVDGLSSSEAADVRVDLGEVIGRLEEGVYRVVSRPFYREMMEIAVDALIDHGESLRLDVKATISRMIGPFDRSRFPRSIDLVEASADVSQDERSSRLYAVVRDALAADDRLGILGLLRDVLMDPDRMLRWRISEMMSQAIGRSPDHEVDDDDDAENQSSESIADVAPSPLVLASVAPSPSDHNMVRLTTGERQFADGVGDRVEWCSLCAKHISRHYGGVEYRCDARAVCRGCCLMRGAHDGDCRVVEREARLRLQSECDHRSEYGVIQDTGDPPGPRRCGRCRIELPDLLPAPFDSDMEGRLVGLASFVAVHCPDVRSGAAISAGIKCLRDGSPLDAGSRAELERASRIDLMDDGDDGGEARGRLELDIAALLRAIDEKR